MSEHKFNCLVCGQRIACDSELAGAQITCPGCDAIVTVPQTFSDTPETDEPNPPAPVPEEVVPGPTSLLAIASLACALLSFVTCIGWLPGIICGHLARAKIRQDPALRGNGLATAGLVISYGFLALIAVATIAGAIVFKHQAELAFTQLAHASNTNTMSAPPSQPAITADSTPANNDSQPAVKNDSQPVANAPSQPAANTDSATPATPSLWTMDLANAAYPQGAASGRVHGADFTVGSCLFKNGDLKITSAGDKTLFVIIRGLDDDAQGHRYELSPFQSGNVQVYVHWSENGQGRSQSFAGAYALKLEFGNIAERKMPAQIYLCLPDDDKSYLAGALDARIAKRKASVE